MMNADRTLRRLACCLGVVAVAHGLPLHAQRIDRRQSMENRNGVIDWAASHSALIKGMTKGEVLRIYGRPDKKFVHNYMSGPLEVWTYYYPRRRAILPFKDDEFSARYRFLYFRDDLLVNFAR
jgi:hypothetical protein